MAHSSEILRNIKFKRTSLILNNDCFAQDVIYFYFWLHGVFAVPRVFVVAASGATLFVAVLGL